METSRYPQPARPFSGLGVKNWWPSEMGEAASSGSSVGLRYAYFAHACRLLIDRQDEFTLYDTGEHHFRGVLLADGVEGALSFMSQRGRVPLESLKIVSP
jgi:hypothetical protein